MNKLIIVVIIVLVIILGGILLVSKNIDETDGPRTPTSADNAPPGSIHNLPVPQAVAAARAYIAAQEGIPVGEVTVISAFEREWSDSCLGLGGPAESCLQAITPGYEVSLEANGKTSILRTDVNGTQIRVER